MRLPDGQEYTEPVLEIGKEQGWLGLPIRIGIDTATGYNTMTSAWEPSPDELRALAAGGKVHVRLLGRGSHPPIMVEVGEPPEDLGHPPRTDQFNDVHNTRVRDAAEQLCRYGRRPRCQEFYDALDALAELNDDLWNMSAPELSDAQAQRIKNAVDAILGWRDAQGVR